MNLKRIIKESTLTNRRAIEAELVLPGEPLIYSIKYSMGTRTRSVQCFRDMKWKALIQSIFRNYCSANVPVVVIVKFYVSPPDYVNVSDRDVRKETVPAVHSFELCDYCLSFLEMLHHVLINSYRQVVKIDMVKFYSHNPRTVFQFMKWDQYVRLQSQNTVHTKSKGIRKDRNARSLQSELQGYGTDEGTRADGSSFEPPTIQATERSTASRSSLPNTSASKSGWKKTPTAGYVPSREEARRRQSREVSE